MRAPPSSRGHHAHHVELASLAAELADVLALEINRDTIARFWANRRDPKAELPAANHWSQHSIPNQVEQHEEIQAHPKNGLNRLAMDVATARELVRHRGQNRNVRSDVNDIPSLVAHAATCERERGNHDRNH